MADEIKDPILEKQKEIAQAKMDEMKAKSESKADDKTKADDKSADDKADDKAKATEEPKGASAEKTEDKADDKAKRIEQKVEKRKEEIQKEIDSLIAQQKNLEGDVGRLKEANDRIARLEDTLLELTEKIGQQETKVKAESEQKTITEKAHQLAQDRVRKYAEEDKQKPFEERREMSEEEQDEFYLESPRKYNEWLYNRNERRKAEAQQDLESLKPKDEKKPDDDFQRKSQESLTKLFAEFPDMKEFFGPNARAVKLREEGKTPEEIVKTFEAENKNFKMFNVVMKEHPEYAQMANGPELVLTEMKKRASSQKTYSEEEVQRIKDEAIREERERLNVDTTISSTRSKSSVNDDNTVKIPKKEFDVWRRAYPNWSEKQIADRIKYIKDRRAKIPGSSVYTDKKDEEETVSISVR